jgi:hypothetical protein
MTGGLSIKTSEKNQNRRIIIIFLKKSIWFFNNFQVPGLVEGVEGTNTNFKQKVNETVS